MPVGRPSRAAVVQGAESAVDELNDRLGGLPSPAEAEGVWRDIWHEETHGSTAIEGNTLVLKQVQALLDQGLAVGNKELAEYMEVRGYADAASWVYTQTMRPGEWKLGFASLTEVRKIHEMSMEPVWNVAPHPEADPSEGPGAFREHDIQPFPEGMSPPPWIDVPARMTDWVEKVEELVAPADQLIEAAAVIHNQFEQIHPFLDGNGRTGRLVLNLILVRLGYPPAIIHKRDRRRYLAAMRRADAGDEGPLAEVIARAITDNIYRFILPGLAGPHRLVPLAALQDGRLNVAALRTAASRGRLRAQKGSDGQWRSSRVWVDDYVGNRYKRGDTR